MEQKEIFSQIANGKIHYQNFSSNIKDIEWVKHPKFTGVSLKHLIKGENTNNQFSSHLVKIDPNCILETHCHEKQWELHEVIEGQGTCNLQKEQHDYSSGKMAVIPKGVKHNVQAGNSGLILLAKFFPALL